MLLKRNYIMLTQTELNIRANTDKLALDIRVTKASINIKNAYARKLISDNMLDEASKKEYEVKLLQMQLRAMESFMKEMQDIEFIIGSDE